MKRVLVTGASSQVGRVLLPQLVQEGGKVAGVSRRPKPEWVPKAVSWRQLDLVRDDWPAADLQRVDTLFHLAPVWVLPEWLARNPFQGLSRMVVFSTSSIVTKSGSGSPAERAYVAGLRAGENAAWEYANARGVCLTIFRPTMIYGLGMDNNVSFIARSLQRIPVFPLVGGGHGLRQPVHVEDLAQACLDVLVHPGTCGKVYHLGGGERLSYREMVRRIARAMGRRVILMPIPAGLMKLVLAVARRIPRYRFLDPEMADRINRDLVFDFTDAQHDFKYNPRRIFLPDCQQYPHLTC
jgi:nucleoside-diphosphate-sugar epimerase